MQRKLHKQLVKALTASMKERGQIVPVLLQPRKVAHRYRIIDGYHRIAAAKALGLTTVIASVDGEIKEVNVNHCSLHWRDPPDLYRSETFVRTTNADLAKVLRRYMKAKNLSAAAVAKEIDRSPTWVRQLLKRHP